MRKFINSLLVLVVFLLAAGIYLFVQLPSAGDSPSLNLRKSEVVVRVGEIVFRVEVAETPEQQARGLAGRETLEADRGMLFVFSSFGVHRFTMNGMLFPLDFIWIRENRVIGVTENAAPGTAVINPPEAVDAVLEVNAGAAAEFGIKAGDAVLIEK